MNSAVSCEFAGRTGFTIVNSAVSCEFNKNVANSQTAVNLLSVVNSFRRSNSQPAVNLAVNYELKIMANSQPAVN